MADVSYEPLAYAWRVLFVLALLFTAGFWLRRRWRPGGPAAGGRRRLHIVETLAVGPQRNLHVVAVGERRYLIGSTPQALTFLTEIETGPDAHGGEDSAAMSGSEAVAKADFETYLQKAGGGTPKEDAVR